MTKVINHKKRAFIFIVGVFIPLFLLISLPLLFLTPNNPEFYYSNTHIVFPTSTSETDKQNVSDLATSSEYINELYVAIINDETYNPNYEVDLDKVNFRWTIDNYHKDVFVIEYRSIHPNNVSLTVKKSSEVLLNKVIEIGIDKNKLTVHGNQEYTFAFDESKDGLAIAFIIPCLTLEFCFISANGIYTIVKNKKEKFEEVNI